MKDILQDLVAHTHSLGFIPLIKVNATGSKTEIEAMAEDRSVIVQGTTKTPVGEFEGVFGMPNLSKLRKIINLEDYGNEATITVVNQLDRDGDLPAEIMYNHGTIMLQKFYRNGQLHRWISSDMVLR